MQIGSEIPAVPLQQIQGGEVETFDLQTLSAGRKILVIGVPGAFAPPCAEQHLPGYLASQAAFAEKGVDEIVVVASNDFFVVDAWSKALCPDGAVRFLADGSQRLAKATGQQLDLSDLGLGLRSQRYVALVQDGRVAQFWVEPEATQVTVTAAQSVLPAL